MKLTFRVLGHPVWSLELDVAGDAARVLAAPPMDKGVKGISRWWVKHMVS